MKITQLHVGGFDHNFSYFIQDENGRDFGIVDPAGTVLQDIEESCRKGLRPSATLITHSHFDHVEKVPHIVNTYHTPVYIHERATGRIDAPSELLRFVKEGDTIPIGNGTVMVMHTPGHIDDAVCFYYENGKSADTSTRWLVTGDTLFVEGCGRADLQNSNVEDLFESLNRIKKLDDATLVYAGHDYGSKPVSNIAWEKKYNAYLHCKTIEEFRKKRLTR